MIPVGKFLSSGEIKVNMDTYINIIPHELQVYVLSYLGYHDFDKFTNTFHVSLTKEDYVFMILSRFKVYYTSSIINYDLDKLYHGLIWKYEDTSANKESINNILNHIRLQIAEELELESYTARHDQVYELYKYILREELATKFGPGDYETVVQMDDLETLQLGVPDAQLMVYISDMIIHNSTKILDYTLDRFTNSEEENAELEENGEDLINPDDLEESKDLIKQTIETEPNIYDETLDIILSYELFDLQDLFDIILHDEYDSWEYLLNTLPVMLESQDYKGLNDMMLTVLYENGMNWDKFMALWQRYLYNPDITIIEPLYKAAISGFTNGNGTFEHLENIIKIITFLANQKTIQDKYLPVVHE